MGHWGTHSNHSDVHRYMAIWQSLLSLPCNLRDRGLHMRNLDPTASKCINLKAYNPFSTPDLVVCSRVEVLPTLQQLYLEVRLLVAANTGGFSTTCAS